MVAGDDEKPVTGMSLVGQPRADDVLQQLRLWTRQAGEMATAFDKCTARVHLSDAVTS
jgi:hypothetical protein